jgi:peroxin-6
MLKAVTRSACQVDDRVAAVNAQRATHNKPPVTIAGFFDHHATPSDLEVQVEEQDFELARKELTPSVSYEELKHYEKVRDQFEGGPKKKDLGQAAVDDEGQEMQTVVNASEKRQMSESDKAFAREKFNELMARRTSSKNSVPQVNGRGGGEDGGGASSGDDDDFVVRTDRLTLNGNGNGNGGGGGRATSRPVGGKGKGRGKSREDAVVDAAEDGGEDLYD